ncbi:ASCH domain-containing protein [Erwinia sp. 9145]|uniref:ASCH domain-containing protein n=1 Tax=Erwinia sp. 9145 TaxID=1500895 RepID=UPI00054D8B83|nr:ASCH domain-containing protein [Erwinia sp. 9145]
MQSLKIVPRLISEVRAGSKTHTIRWCERVITPGPMLYINTEDATDSVEVLVTGVSRMPLSAVAEFLGKTEEWPDAVLLAGMREHYPDINMVAGVEVIHHLPPSAGGDDRKK